MCRSMSGKKACRVWPTVCGGPVTDAPPNTDRPEGVIVIASRTPAKLSAVSIF